MYQLASLKLPLWRVTHLFFTHLHGDHCFGAPTLVYNRLLAFAAARCCPAWESHLVVWHSRAILQRCAGARNGLVYARLPKAAELCALPLIACTLQ